MKTRFFAVCAMALAVAAYQGAAGAAETGHGSMPGMHGGGHAEGHEAMMKGEADVVSGWKNKLQTTMANVMPSGALAEQHRKKTEPGSAKK